MRRVREGMARVRPVRMPDFGIGRISTHRRVKGRKVVQATRRLGASFDAWRAGRTSFACFDAAVRGWINHVRYADSWGLREQVLRRFVW